MILNRDKCYLLLIFSLGLSSPVPKLLNCSTFSIKSDLLKPKVSLHGAQRIVELCHASTAENNEPRKII